MTDRLPRETDPSLRLALEFDDGRTRSLPHSEPLLIGSAEDCELRISDRFASFRHARITHTPKGYLIEDLGSTNGTLVDGVPIASAILGPGMSVEIGRVRMSITRIDKPVDEARPRRARGGPRGGLTIAPIVPLHPDKPTHRLIGRSRTMKTLRRQLEKLALLPLPVLLRGETGTGKELAARTLHDFGTLPETPFIALNCGAIPDGLFESELFGHQRGAFTGAHRDHAGAFIRAGHGTVFLDEVAELPAHAQAKLLRVLETRRLTPVGAEKELRIDCHIIAATHRDLAAMVAAGEFREDLYHRLSVVQLELPPLRRRRSDIPVLLEFFIDLASAELGREVVVSQAAVAKAIVHTWPGNVRALRNAVLRAAALSEGPITAAELIPPAEQTPSTRGDQISVPRGTYAHMHAALLQQVVAEEGSIRQAARILEVPRSTLSAWLRRLDPRELECQSA
jgi:DNA-binding NtrC family response regulator